MVVVVTGGEAVIGGVGVVVRGGDVPWVLGVVTGGEAVIAGVVVVVRLMCRGWWLWW